MEDSMRLRDLWNRHQEQPQNPEPGNTPGRNLDRLRQAGEGFLAAGDEAIQRALSSDSEAFLRANRQKGGQ